MRFLCRIGIHDWDKWKVRDILLRTEKLGIVIERDLPGWEHTRSCKACGEFQSKLTRSGKGAV